MKFVSDSALFVKEQHTGWSSLVTGSLCNQALELKPKHKLAKTRSRSFRVITPTRSDCSCRTCTPFAAIRVSHPNAGGVNVLQGPFLHSEPDIERAAR
ncbi:unnamed protein product, partial [Nesidiocoris tenuis]